METAEFVPPEGPEVESEVRESIKIQAMLAEIGSEMGMKIWIPKADRGGVLREWKDGSASLLDRLPLNYDDATLKTVEQIDVLWLRGRSIIRAFEVEHTTSIYSGLLRMADLLALSAQHGYTTAHRCADHETGESLSGNTKAGVFVARTWPAVRTLHLSQL